MGMRHEEAIEILEEVKVLDDSMFAYNSAYCQAFDLAIDALKAQEPRVMTLQEAQTALHNDIVVWVEVKTVIYSGLFCGFRIDGSDHFIMQNGDVLHVTNLDSGDGVELYGESIRCWTAKPDEKVRAETPWGTGMVTG